MHLSEETTQEFHRLMHDKRWDALFVNFKKEVLLDDSLPDHVLTKLSYMLLSELGVRSDKREEALFFLKLAYVAGRSG